MTLFRLFSSVSLSHFKQEKLKAFLTILGMTLGIAVYAGIRFASQNVFESFEASTQILTGTQNRIIVSDSGRIDESDIKRLQQIENISAWIPLSQRQVEITDGNGNVLNIQAVGIDILKARPFNFLPPDSEKNNRGSFLKLLDAKPYAAIGQNLFEKTGKPETITILANTEEKNISLLRALPDKGLGQTYGGNILLFDIAAYQEVFEDFGKIDQLAVLLKPETDEEEIQRELSKHFNGRLHLLSGQDRSQEGRRMTEAFNLNLQFLAGVSLVVAILLIYNSVSYAVLKRRKEIGTLISMGAKPKQLFRLVTFESIVIGFVSALLGAFIGYALSFMNVRFMTLSISNLYFPVEVATVAFKPRVLLECLLLGPLLAWAGCILPCLEILKVPPRETFHYQNYEEKFKKWLPPLTIIGLCCLLIGIFFSDTAWLQKNLLMGFLPPTFLIFGFVLLVPISLNKLIYLGKRLFQSSGSLPAFLALDHIQSTLQRNAIAIASAMIAVGMFLGMTTMILSFRGTVVQWIEHVTKADMFISSPYAISGAEGGYLPEALIQELPRHPDIKDYDWIASKQIRLEDLRVKVNGVKFETIAAYDRLLFMEPAVQAELENIIRDDSNVFISETLAVRSGLKIGDSLRIPGLNESRNFTIKNIFYDYSSDQGVVLIRDKVFEKLFSEKRKQGIALYLHKHRDPAAIKEWINKNFGQHSLLVRDNQSLRNQVMEIFDQTFRITHALQWIALLIAAFTILNTILMLTLERAREFGVLRALGAGAKVIVRMIVYEALLLGAAALAGGILVGFALALVLVFVVNKFFFAWSVVFMYPWTVLFSTIAGTLLLATLAGWVPAKYFARKIDARLLRYE